MAGVISVSRCSPRGYCCDCGIAVPAMSSGGLGATGLGSGTWGGLPETTVDEHSYGQAPEELEWSERP
jgi:hypothetical protein